jgi:hypothetical protein
VLLLGASGVAAQPAEDYEGGIAVGPLKLVADAVPGQTWHGSFRMVGRGAGQSSEFELDVMDLAQDITGQKTAIERGKGARSAADWIDVVSEVTLAPGEKRDVSVTIRVPSDAYGAYSAYVLVNLRRDEPAEPFATAVVPTVNVEVLVRVQSRGPLEIEAQSVRLVEANEAGAVSPAIDIRNTGVWPSEIEGDVLLYPAVGGFPQRFRLPYRIDGRPYELYPGQKIRLVCTPAARVPPGDHRVVSRIYLGERKESRSEFSLAVGGGAQGSPAAGEADRRMELGTDLWIEEPIHEVDAPPGAARSVVVRLRNLGETTVSVRAAVEDARLEEDGRWIYSVSESTLPGLVMAVSPDSLLIGPGANAAVRANIELAREAALDSTVVKAVRFTGRSHHAAGSGWEAIYDTGALIIVKPTSAAAASLEVVGLEFIRAAPDRNPGSAVLTLANRGTGIGGVKGRIVLMRENGELVSEMPIGRTTWQRVMPGRERKFRMPLPPLDEGPFVVAAELSQKDATGPDLRVEARFTSVSSIPEGLR